jgi:uncharacterized protein YceK
MAKIYSHWHDAHWIKKEPPESDSHFVHSTYSHWYARVAIATTGVVSVVGMYLPGPQEADTYLPGVQVMDAVHQWGVREVDVYFPGAQVLDVVEHSADETEVVI